jgi:hypothetical protein
MVAYATKQADMYQEMAEWAEITRTEVKLRKGKKRVVFEPTWDPVMAVDEGEGGEEGDRADEGEDEEDKCGDIDSDEELLMGGEVDED